MTAQVERHPSEDDEVFVSNLTLLSGGAAANTAYACGKMGLRTAFIGKLGHGDIFANKIISDFNEVSVETKLIKYSNRYTTGSAYVALDEVGERRIYAYSGAANYLSKSDLLEEEIVLTKLIFLSNLKNIEPLLHAAKIGKNRDIPVILNPGMLIIDQGFEYIRNLLEQIDILILSQREFKILFNLKDENLSEALIKKKSAPLFALKIKVIIVTLGKNGAFLLTPKHNELIQTLKLERVIDTTGAGDAFSAGLIFGLVQKLSLKFEHLRNNVKIGNFVAGNCIQKLGARNGIPGRNDVKTFLENTNKKI